MVTSMKKMTETIYYMVSSATETIFIMTVLTAVTVEAEMTVMTVTVATEINSSNRYIEQQLTSRENANAKYFLITARR